uniref:Uncharacterized protein n=1 Tax=Nelumbo nucifera TaxID=4432 RepID=A0A822Z5T5_NELNU|nr:TPA_asm: hypothetical protein HUJ06_007529 [Nelumbo nucifera]
MPYFPCLIFYFKSHHEELGGGETQELSELEWNLIKVNRLDVGPIDERRISSKLSISGE